jgi:hypothetical protein
MFYLEKLVGSRGGLAPMHRWAGMLLCKCQSCQAFWGSLLSAGRQVYLVDVTQAIAQVCSPWLGGFERSMTMLAPRPE